MAKYTCPCCGFKTLDNEPPGSFDICPICFWEDDNIQFDDPDYHGGANKVSLRQAQKNYLQLGACEREMLLYVRKPTAQDQKDRDWEPVE